ncbi:hypothetical protein ASG82_17790 [Mycobacterium sp. Soil538]|nr:hypothetical protein ASG82_17790 [Mycobacterium sp. Soil538]
MTRGVLPALLVCAVLLAPACTRSSDGAATAQSAESATPTTSSATTTSVAPPVVTTDDTPGVVPTPGTSAADEDCAPAAPPAVPVDVRIGDPKAPTVVVGAPEGWTTTPTPDGVTLTGPDGMSGTVTIAETALDPAAAFRRYADDLTASTTMSTMSLLPAETCGFSGQKLMGQLGGTVPDTVLYQARIVHVPGYLIAVYVEAPTGTTDFDAEAPVLTQGLQIGLP